ncbi:CrcB family protein [Weissella paramesenteroides]
MAEIMLTGLGAMCGSLIRFGLLTVAPRWFGKLADLMVVCINLLAALGMGIVVVLILPDWLHTILAPGILGGLSTFSAPIVDIADAIQKPHGPNQMLVFKTIMTFIGGLIIFWLGMQIGQNLL